MTTLIEQFKRPLYTTGIGVCICGMVPLMCMYLTYTFESAHNLPAYKMLIALSIVGMLYYSLDLVDVVFE